MEFAPAADPLRLHPCDPLGLLFGEFHFLRRLSPVCLPSCPEPAASGTHVLVLGPGAVVLRTFFSQSHFLQKAFLGPWSTAPWGLPVCSLSWLLPLLELTVIMAVRFLMTSEHLGAKGKGIPVLPVCSRAKPSAQ